MESLQAVMQNEAWEPCPVGEGFSVLSLAVSMHMPHNVSLHIYVSVSFFKMNWCDVSWKVIYK